jgi:hypothetical protein
LRRAQANFAATRKFCPASRGTEPIKFAHTVFSNPVHSLHIALRNQRQKTGQSRQCKSATCSRREAGSKVRSGSFQGLQILPISQTEWRFQSRVKPLFTRCHSDVIQTGYITWGRGAATRHIPTEPGRAKISQGPFRRHIVNCKSRV